MGLSVLICGGDGGNRTHVTNKDVLSLEVLPVIPGKRKSNMTRSLALIYWRIYVLNT